MQANLSDVPKVNVAGGKSPKTDIRVICCYSGLMATVTVTPAALAQLAELPRDIIGRVNCIFARLEKWPAVSGAKALRGTLAGRFRVRTGDYRIQFHVSGDRVVVEKIGHRDGFYDE